jgi:peptide chain release factor 2
MKSRLYQLELEKRNAEIAKIESSKLGVDFGSQIRNYVLHPYKLVKDKRSGHETSHAQNVLDGGLNEFMKAYLLAQSEVAASKD